jgi:UDP-N-acetylglucosamine--N-acetylmuramyl-(pentapeptide) pyrophosphoryl-undecaprenol N-acetylglucosamine transferase
VRSNIIFCGGGSGGHVLPALTLIKELQNKYPECQISCIGGYSGVEAQLLGEYNYRGISTGKLRRYLSVQNAIDIFKVALGIFQAYRILFSFDKSKTLIVSTGGFVTVPVVFAAWLQGKPVVLHEQTTRAGLANRVSSIFARKCFLTFEESLNFFPIEKSLWTGYPLRREIFEKFNNSQIKILSKNTKDLPVLFLTGGGNGSKLLNEALSEILPLLKESYFIIHQCGEKFLDEYKAKETDFYKVYDFINSEMITLLKESEVVISRAGAGTVCELIALGKPSILVPLRIAQKNEQFHNAVVAKKRLGSILLEETNLNGESLLGAINSIRKVKSSPIATQNPLDKILEEIGKV